MRESQYFLDYISGSALMGKEDLTIASAFRIRNSNGDTQASEEYHNGGLMSSIALRRLGHRVHILERSQTPLLHDQGAGIVFGDYTRAFFDLYDRTNTIVSVTSRERLYLDRAGNVISRKASVQQMTSWDLLYHVLRANFDGLRSDYVREIPEGVLEGAVRGDAAYHHGVLVTGVRDTGSGVEISWKSNLSGEEAETLTKLLIADNVIIADGSSSTMRAILTPSSATRTYAGYVAFRGTVSESMLSSFSLATFREKFVFYHAAHIQILAYLIPGRNGSTREGERLVNWVWYWNVEQGSDEFRWIFTDRRGKLHRFTLPPGDDMDPQVWGRQRRRARMLLPPQFAELVERTERPFAQAITDLPPPADGPAWYLENDGAVMVGDAVAGFRPHTAGSTGQAAHHALMLPNVRGVFDGDGHLTRDAYSDEVRLHAVSMQRLGVELGQRSQFGGASLNTLGGII
ncbi:2,6-dihydroxypyridine 3-monooxygenase-like protein [Cladobotryum mycophilum]|uniref:2,6-dihydroxypyridine 3-monooxygenase-like protein n=1 Tax=Cladobotryum mycophilum TaxID=491253 RepID=A0ABR0SLI4_9HYPO